jgi:hypothetical protein
MADDLLTVIVTRVDGVERDDSSSDKTNMTLVAPLRFVAQLGNLPMGS